MRHRADKNQQKIIDELRELGVSVLVLSQVGGGCPDLLIGFRGKNYLIEVKTPVGKLRPKQTEFIFNWHGRPVLVARSLDEILGFIGAK